MRVFKNISIDFVSKRKAASLFSIVMIVIGIGAIVVRGGLNLAIDFTGGTEVQLRFEQPMDIGDARKALEAQGIENPSLVTIGSDRELLLYTQLSGPEVKEEVQAAFADREFETRRIEQVGPKIGKETSNDAFLAIMMALLLILFYIMFRFDFYYALGSVAALVHDILITVGIFAIFNLEINLIIVAAFLTIVGYSLNDTIVVYDRIRENIKAYASKSLEDIVNISLNTTLNRTVITSVTTLLVVISLLIFSLGHIVLFATALFIGILIGTYSSIFVASPVMIFFENKQHRKLKKKK